MNHLSSSSTTDTAAAAVPDGVLQTFRGSVHSLRQICLLEGSRSPTDDQAILCQRRQTMTDALRACGLEVSGDGDAAAEQAFIALEKPHRRGTVQQRINKLIRAARSGNGEGSQHLSSGIAQVLSSIRSL